MIVRHLAREQITISNSAKTLTAATVTANVEYAEVQVLAQNIRVTFDGSTAPVKDTTGTIWYAEETYRVWGVENCKNLKMIRDAASDATVVVNYWGRPSV